MAVSARDIRRYTARASAGGRGAGSARSAQDVWYTVTTAVLVVFEVAAVIRALTIGLRASDWTTDRSFAWGGAAPDPSGLAAAVLLMFAAVVLHLAIGAGPIALTRPQAQWWLPLPVDRRGLLVPGLRIRLLATAVVVFAGSALIFLGLTAFERPWDQLSAALAVAALAVLAFAAASAAQIGGSGRPLLRWIATAVLVLVPVLLVVAGAAGAAAGLRWLVFAPTGWPVLAGGGGVWASATLVLAAVVAVTLVWLRLDRVTGAEMLRSAATADRAAGALLSMDASAILERSVRFRRRIRWRLGRPLGAGLPAVAARIVSAQALVWVRAPGRLAELLFWAVLPAAVLTIPASDNSIVLAVVLLAASFRVVTISGHVARELAGNPSLGSAFPVSAGAERRIASVLPAGVIVCWLLVCGGLLTVAGAVPAGWIALALVAAIGLAGAAVRSAYRPDPDWSRPMLATDAGNVPTGVVLALIHGRDTTVVTLVPLLVVTVTGVLPPAAFTIQAVLSVIVWLIGTWPRAHRP